MRFSAIRAKIQICESITRSVEALKPASIYDGRLREPGRASSATGYTSSAVSGGGVSRFSFFGEEKGDEKI
jgi:hypothetical protein